VSSTVAIVVQARMSSTRLPGKVLLPLAGAPAIVRMMERVSHVTSAGLRIVATSDHGSDDPLAEICRENGIAVHRGSLDDVLGRVLGAVPAECDTVVRLTGDCPLVDPALVDRHIDVYLRERPRAEYVTNAVHRTQPDGLDVEVVGRELLVRADREATSAFDREHVLTWARDHAREVAVTQKIDLSRLRWTLDTGEDYETISAVYGELYPGGPRFDSRDVYRLWIRKPGLIRVCGLLAPDAEERAAWVERIRAHLAEEESGS
jgi:spore coat polysaccharide biosynthesis protein SpsF